MAGLMSRVAQWERNRVELTMMLALTFTTGIIDAIGFLGLDRVFTANMTGNVVIMGMGLVGSTNLPVLGPALAFAGFVLGAGIAAAVQRRARTGWSGFTTIVLTICALIPLAMGILAEIEGHVVPHTPTALTITGLLGLAMGAQAATARRIGVKDVTTVVITSTITGMAADSRLAGGNGSGTGRRVWAIALMFLGALVGALLLLTSLGVALLVAGGLMLLVIAVGHTIRPRRDAAAATA